MNAKALYSILFVMVNIASWAQVQFGTQISRDKIGINEVLEVRFVMNVDGDHINPPNFSNFQVVGGPMQSYNSSWVNGKTSRTVSVGYFLQPTKKGKITIGSATMEYEGKTYKTQPVTIEVGDAVAQQPRQQTHRSRSAQSIWDDFFGDQREPVQQPQLPQNLGQGIFLVAHVNKTSAFVNEPITIEYRLYVSYYSSANNMQVVNMPKFNNFWNHILENKEQRIQEGTYKGKVYRYIVLQKGILLPQKEGNLTIDPMELELLVENPTGRTDVFGRPEMDRGMKKFSSGAQTINVKPLPLQNKPDNFEGAVGKFTFTKSVNKATTKANEPIELYLTVKGQGNLQLINLPTPIVPNALEIYEPETIDKISNNLSTGMEGSRTYKYVIVPQYKGKYTIEPISFSYFDTETKSYKTITTEETIIDVAEGPELPTNGPEREEILKTNEFQPNRTNIKLDASNGWDLANNDYFLWLVGLPLLAIPAVLLFGKIRSSRNADIEGLAQKKSNKLVKKYLSTAKKELGNKESFYEALEKCLHNFLKASLKMETKDMSNDTIEELLHNHAIDQDTIQQFFNIKANCEMARYAQFTATDQQSDYQNAAQVIQSIDKQLKSKK